MVGERNVLSDAQDRGLIDSLSAAEHVMEMFRRSLPNSLARNRLLRLCKRLFKILAEIRKLRTA